MKKSFLLASTLIFSLLTSYGQIYTKIKVRQLVDSLPINEVSVQIDYVKYGLNTVSGKTDLEGLVIMDLVGAEPFNLILFKDGYKPLISLVNSAPSELIVYLKYLVYDGEEVTVNATRISPSVASTYTLLTKKEIEWRNFGQDIPILLQNTPSAVTTSDAGAGIGYTGIRIRGIDPSRINVTVNGVPLNDAESQSVFWVNMPDFASGVQDIQVQRGVGTSSNGSGAFGASINIKTDKFNELPFAKVSQSFGSFNSYRTSVKVGTGKMLGNWYAEGRMSWIGSEGFVDRATSDLKAWNFAIGHKSKKSFFQAIVFSGNEKTYQAWNGVPLVKFLNDSSGVDSFINNLGYDSLKARELRVGDPSTYNYYTYKNETDNYEQSHLQLVYNRNLGKNLIFNLMAHGTLGKGYFENFEPKAALHQYMDTPVVHYGNSYRKANLIHQRWLDNSFYGMVFSLLYNTTKWNQTLGGAYNIYLGHHFGKVIWHEFINANNEPFNYYDNQSTKKDATIYYKAQYKWNKDLILFSDLQLRSVNYSWFGPSSLGIIYLPPAQQGISYLFFNPKLGLNYQLKNHQLIYVNLGRASREPTREDFINTSISYLARPEFLNNIETGFKSSYKDLKYTITGYYMNYKDQLTLNGELNSVGSPVHINIPNSYRAGIEFEASLKIASWLNWSWNLALSRNKIKKFTEIVYDFYSYDRSEYQWENTDLALSPNRVIGSVFSVKAAKNLEILINTKSVGRQYLDNTQTLSRSLEPYVVNDLMVHYLIAMKASKVCNLSLMLANIGNANYASNGYTYSGIINNSRKDFSFVYPQAGTHFLARLEFTF
jgi:iron complex outermembrane receptor protein